ncbi:MAG: 4Fe-4S binding protein [Candidatus Gastranaerophilales bacterium]|nr:4Fe-4S binding protein [Candidatus Gastranaerophilales bacterium]
MPHQIITNICSGCAACIEACPVEAIEKIDNKIQINPDECVDCDTCKRICPDKCVDGGPDRYLELRNG